LIAAFLGHNPLTGRLPSGDPITTGRDLPRDRRPRPRARQPGRAGATPPPLPARTRFINSAATLIITLGFSTTQRTVPTTHSSAGSRSATILRTAP
jgi:hypothetical protein